jgi:ATP-dependent Clp protease adaptor protein ClpS
MSTKGKEQTVTKIQPREDIEPPKNFKVIYLNDEVTTMEFVIQSLMEIFDYNFDDAATATRKVHEDGSAVVAVLPFELAEHKGVLVTMQARASGFPLQVKIEPED